MRILLVHPGPDFSVHDVAMGWNEGLREAGATVDVYNLNDRLIFFNNIMVNSHQVDDDGRPIAHALKQDLVFRMAMEGLPAMLWEFMPDVVMFVSAFFSTAKMFTAIRRRGHKIVFLATESPYQDDEQLMRAPYADLTLINDPVNLAKFREIGPAEYVPHSYRPAIHHTPGARPEKPAPASDFVFIGTAFESRIKFFEQLDLDGIDTMIAGNNWGQLDSRSSVAKHVAIELGSRADCVHNHEAAALYRASKMGLNLYRREGEEAHENDQAEAMSPREVEQAACGLPFLRDPRPEGDRVLHMLPTFDGPADASEKLRYYLAHDRERERIAAQAHEAIADRTFASNARKLLKRLEDL